MSEQALVNAALAPEELIEKILANSHFPLTPHLAVRSDWHWPADLTAHQVEILNRACQTPDFFLVDGITGTGKTRLALELTRHQVEQGKHVLIVSPHPDALLSQIPHAVRGVARGETLSPEVEARTLNGLLKQARNTLITEAQNQRHLAQQTWQTCRQQLEHLQRFQQLSRQLEELQQQQQNLLEKESQIEGAVQAKLPELVAKQEAQLLEQIQTTQDQLTAVRQKVSETAKQLAIRLSEVTSQRAKANPRRSGWLFFWKTKTDPQAEQQLQQLEQQLAETEQANQQAQQELQAAEKRLSELQEERARKEQAILAQEKSQATQQIQTERQALESRLQVARAEWTSLKEFFGEKIPTEEELQPQLAQAEANLKKSEDDFHKAQQKATSLTREQLPLSSVIVAPPVAVLTDPAITSRQFDWLVIDDAHRLGHGQAMACSRKASRIFILGDSHALGAQEFFAPLAHRLHRKVWITEGYRRICRRIELNPFERTKLECEPLADTPEVELRLHTPDDADPVIAEIAFPSSWPEARCRELLARELGEVTATPQGTCDWTETDLEIALNFNTVETTTISILHADQVLERVVPGSLTFSFSKENGWTREKIRLWMIENLYRGNSGRLAYLTQAQRACPGLARWLNKHLGMHYQLDSTPDEEPHVELLAVPERPRSPREDRPARAVFGAGLECNLAEQRSREPRPNIPNLPNTGIINLREAENVIQLVDSIPDAVVVTALSAPQLVVLKHLVQQANLTERVRVLSPEEVLQSEPTVLVISLVRSHPNMAVRFLEPPLILKSLMLRARRRLIFVGDVGGLERRAHWRGTVEPEQPIHEAELENQLVQAILHSQRIHLQPSEKKMALANSG